MAKRSAPTASTARTSPAENSSNGNVPFCGAAYAREVSATPLGPLDCAALAEGTRLETGQGPRVKESTRRSVRLEPLSPTPAEAQRPRPELGRSGEASGLGRPRGTGLGEPRSAPAPAVRARKASSRPPEPSGPSKPCSGVQVSPGHGHGPAWPEFGHSQGRLPPAGGLPGGGAAASGRGRGCPSASGGALASRVTRKGCGSEGTASPSRQPPPSSGPSSSGPSSSRTPPQGTRAGGNQMLRVPPTCPSRLLEVRLVP
jgi:hypothetical protein